jgi:hypothetical protein
MTIIRDKFDFEVGYLVKSPCIQCESKKNLPKCIDHCQILDKIREKLARGISCSSNKS